MVGSRSEMTKKTLETIREALTMLLEEASDPDFIKKLEAALKEIGS